MTENYEYCILAVSRTYAQGCKLLQIIGRSEQSKGAKLQCCFAGLLFFTGTSSSFIFQIEKHLEKECPNTEIKCPFHIIGCPREV